MRNLSFSSHLLELQCFFQGKNKGNKAERICSSHLLRQLRKFNLQNYVWLPREEKKKRQKDSRVVKFQSHFNQYSLDIVITNAVYVKDFEFFLTLPGQFSNCCCLATLVFSKVHRHRVFLTITEP
jgi:hypothetical protein